MIQILKALALLQVLIGLLPVTSFANGNERPVISNLNVQWKKNKKSIDITFDLFDKEDSRVKIILKASDDKGESFLLNTADARGAIGFPVSVGTSKKITWTLPTTVDARYLQIMLIADDLYKVNAHDLINEVDEQNLKRLVEHVTGERNQYSPNAIKHIGQVRNLIDSSFTACHLNVSKQLFTYPDKIGEGIGMNIIGHLRGQGDENAMYVLSAHYDCAKNSPGADDNATGVAGMIEAMRVLSTYQYEKSIKFIGFDFEEDDLLGSKAYVDKNGIKQFERLYGVINYDMIGFSSDAPNSQFIPDGFDVLFPEVYEYVSKNEFKGNFVVNTANENSQELGKRFAKNSRLYVPDLGLVSLVVAGSGEETPNLAASDHYEFWVNGYRALHIGDGGESRNENLNGPSDKIHLLNMSFAKKVVQATIATMVDLAGINHSTSVIVQIP